MNISNWTSRARIVGPLGNRLGTVLIITLLPVPLVSLLYAVHSIATGTPPDAYSMPSGYLFYGIVNLGVVGLLYVLLTPSQRRQVFVFKRPSLVEIGAAITAFVLGLGVFQLTNRVSLFLGYELQGLSYSLGNSTAFVAVLLGAVILAPVTEEILYRGLVLGTLVSRGFGPVSATLLMTGLFAVIHLPNFGVAGTIFISVWGVLPAVLRLRYDNLTTPVLMHGLNNFFAYVIVIWAGWA